jgi:chemotaxis protein MotC
MLPFLAGFLVGAACGTQLFVTGAAAEDHGEAQHTAAPEGAAEGKSDDSEAPKPPPLWPEVSAVETEKQPYMLIRSLRSVQDAVASGSVAAHERQRQLMSEISVQMTELPVAVWDDVRNVRAAIFFVLSGGNPIVIKPILDRPKTPHVERRALRGALAYGEGRVVDALGLLSKLEARKLDPQLGGIVALIQGTLASRKDPIKAIAFFDEARLLSPGTLIEEAALRQQILLLAREGELERFDLLAAQYTRRFPNSLFARGFRRQFFAGVAKQNFKRASEWISRTETELMKVPAQERIGLYLAIAEEATRGGSLDIARFAAGKARELSQAGSRSYQRAALFEGAALAATEDFGQGVEMLNKVDPTSLALSDREVRDSALSVAGAVGKWPSTPAALDEPEPASVARAQSLLTKVNSLLGETTP